MRYIIAGTHSSWTIIEYIHDNNLRNLWFRTSNSFYYNFFRIWNQIKFVVLAQSIIIKLTPALDGDYDSLKYQPIDFRQNDTTRAEYVLSDYYAYDDGTAEYGASLVQPGSQLAYLFELNTNKLDTIVRVDLYFPKFGDETSQVMQLQILRDLTNSPGSVLYTENITIQRSQQNKVWRHLLTRPIGVIRASTLA